MLLCTNSCLLGLYVIKKTRTWKIPTRKILTNQTPLWWISPGIFPPRNFPPGIISPMFLHIPTRVFQFFVFLLLSLLSLYCYCYHWYYLKDYFVVLYFNSAEVRNSEVNISKEYEPFRPKWLHTQKGLAAEIW